MRGKLFCRALVGTALAVCLFTHSAMAAKTVSKDVCVLSFGMNWQTSADAQAFLLTTAKRQAVGELFGEVIRSITQVRNFQLTRDDIEAVSAGFIRVQGSPEYYKGQGLGEVCVRLTAYVTDADVARFAPRPVQKKVCIGDPRLSLGEIRKTAERQARIQAVRDVEPGLEQIGDEVVLGLMHEGRTELGGFLPDTTVYCTTVSGTVYPIELLTVREGHTLKRSRETPRSEVKRLTELGGEWVGSSCVGSRNDGKCAVQSKFSLTQSGDIVEGTKRLSSGHKYFVYRVSGVVSGTDLYLEGREIIAEVGPYDGFWCMASHHMRYEVENGVEILRGKWEDKRCGWGEEVYKKLSR